MDFLFKDELSARMDFDLIDDLLETARMLKLSTEYCLRCELVTPRMYETKTCGHLYCYKCLKKIKKCIKCNKKINMKELVYKDIQTKAINHINTFQKEIDKLRHEMNMEQRNKPPNSKTSVATVSKTFEAKFEEGEHLFSHDYCDCMDYSGIHFRPGIKNQKSWINRRSPSGQTYLLMACRYGKVKVVQTLLFWGADINVQDNTGSTPLHKAIGTGNLKLVEDLLKRGALVNVPTEKYNTPLHKAVFDNNLKMAHLLITYGADITIANYEGKAPWTIATGRMRDLMDSMIRGQMIVPTPILRKQFKFYIMGTIAFRYSYPMRYLMRFIDITFADEINEEVTHVIYEGRSKIIPFTYNFLRAIVYRVPVVTKEWIEVCATFKQLHSYTEYLIVGTQDHIKDAVNRAVINKMKMEPRLFSGCSFYVPEPENEKCFNIDKDVVSRDKFIELLTAGGAKILDEIPDSKVKTVNFPWHAMPHTIIANCCRYVVYFANDVPVKRNENNRFLRYVPHTWIYECILHYRIIPPNLKT